MDNENIVRGGGHKRGCQIANFVVNFGRELNNPSCKAPKLPSPKLAFTLAEVLITLVIIGIVAALTIPSVVVSYQKHQTVTQLKKVYTSLTQTTNKAIADHGPMKNWEIEKDETQEFVEKYIVPYVKVARNCGYEREGACEYHYYYLNDRNTQQTYGRRWYKLFFNDGSAVFMRAWGDEFNNKGKIIPRRWLYIYIDVNGQKGPNIMGKDLHSFNYWIKNDHTPAGEKDSSGTFSPNGGFTGNRNDYKSWGCNKNGTGAHCAGLIMIDGWQIKKDYPW